MTERAAYRISEFAVAIGVHRATIYRWIKEGQIPTLRIGSLVLIPAHILACDTVRQRCDSVQRFPRKTPDKLA